MRNILEKTSHGAWCVVDTRTGEVRQPRQGTLLAALWCYVRRIIGAW